MKTKSKSPILGTAERSLSDARKEPTKIEPDLDMLAKLSDVEDFNIDLEGKK